MASTGACPKRCKRCVRQLTGCEGAMRPRHVLLLSTLLSSCVTAKYPSPITSETKVELPTFLISCKLNDIIILSAPPVGDKKASYYLSKPNGDVIKLSGLQSKLHKPVTTKDTINDTIINNDSISPTKYRVFNVNNPTLNSTNDIFNDNLKKLVAMEFMIGPLGEDDHGNWVLSVYYTDLNGEDTEMFQVISIEIIENVAIEPKFPKINEGSTFNLRFAYPIKYLESCELRAPKSTFDRYFDRAESDLNSCAFVLPNVTRQDQGWWGIIGVGKIVYEAKVYLKVINKKI